MAEALDIRALRHDDIGQVIALWEEAGFLPTGPDGLTVDEALDTMLTEGVVCLVAASREGIVGSAFALVAGALGVIGRVAVADPASVTDPLLDRLEATLLEQGARKLICWPQAGDPVDQLAARGYEQVEGAALVGRTLPPTVTGPSAVERLGGRMVDPALWDSLRGMERDKEIIERRVILPLSEPDLANRHGVVLPKASVLFGPPGTGKTTFAKGIASRLQWPFIEVNPAELGGDGAEQQVKALEDLFELILDLASAVVFVDEVEDLASVRQGDRQVASSVTNEFLRQIPRLRDKPNHLLVCATNWVGRLDPAFLRPGRFDYVLPVGPPDEKARAAMWERYVEEITDEDVDVDRLVDESAWFTPADIEFAARKAAQIAFEREHFHGRQHRAVTEDFLTALQETRPTLTEEMIEAFEHDTGTYARY